jgi:hypothetical protein
MDPPAQVEGAALNVLTPPKSVEHGTVFNSPNLQENQLGEYITDR